MTAPRRRPLAEQVVVIVGGSSGIGRVTARRFAEEGAKVIAGSSSNPLDAYPAGVDGIELDVSREDHWKRAVGDAIARYGRIDILVNNAGIIRRADSLDFTEEDWDAVIDTNLKTAFFLSQAVARTWAGAGRGGKIINICSMLSFQGGIRVPSYTASKSGLAGLTRLLACEWAARGINVNAIAPGYFSTNNTEALRADETRNRDILARIPAGRWGDPSDISGAAVFLASDAAAYVHGTVLAVDGGWLAR